MTEKRQLPPGQNEASSFHRFGLYKFAYRLPDDLSTFELVIGGDVETSLEVCGEFSKLERIEQTSDFHCVTTWSVFDQQWSGVRFSDFYESIILPLVKPKENAKYVIFHGGDSYSCCMLLEDLLKDNVLLADGHGGEALSIAHGAPLRLVAPSHYGYKSVKHIKAIEFCCDTRNYRFPFPYPNMMDHQRARVEFEERARFPFVSNKLIGVIYRLLIPSARRKNRKGLEKYLDKHSK